MTQLERLDNEIINLEIKIEKLRDELQADPENEKLALALDKCYEREAIIKPQYCRLFVRSITIL